MGGLVSIHAGVKSNSIEDIKNVEAFQQRIKYDIAHDLVHFLEIGQLKDITSYLDKVFPGTGLKNPLILGSDNHNARDYRPRVLCWMKADPTFLGLRQVVNEPRERVWIGASPDHLAYVGENRGNYISSIEFVKRPGSPLDEGWFSGVSLEFNSGLVAIIGNKGSGKSALVDVLGLLGNCPHVDSYSFLTKDQFQHPRDNKASQFEATLKWLNGKTVTESLDSRPDEAKSEAVRYIPQNYLEDICDELKGGRAGRFGEELKRVVFSRVPKEEKAGHNSLDELISYLTDAPNREIVRLKEEIERNVAEFLRLYEQLKPEFRKKLEDNLAELERELADLEAEKPEPVFEPDAKDTSSEETRHRIDAVKAEISTLDEAIQVEEGQLESAVSKLRIIDRIRGRVDELRKRYESTIADIQADCATLGVQPEQVVSLNISTTPLDSVENEADQRRSSSRSKLESEGPESLHAKRRTLLEQCKTLENQLDQPQREFQKYLSDLAAWQNRKQTLIGAENTEGTVEYFKARLVGLDSLPGQIASIQEVLDDLVGCLFEQKKLILEVYKQLYAPVQEFIDTHPLVHDRFGLEFNAGLVAPDFPEQLLAHINQGRRGSFYGEQEGRSILSRMLSAADFQTKEGVLAFVRSAIDHLTNDRRQEVAPTPSPVRIEQQLKKGFTLQDIYCMIYGLDYLKPLYMLQWQGKPLELLSPGERGTLLLVFFLLIDNAKTPLIIDQPEGNLDNQTVYELLVDCIKEAKKHRQIIIVTHNPNLAVVCDAEQVIRAQLDKEHAHQLSYESGALENRVIGRAIVDVLEGTKPAIDNRIAKYEIIFQP